MSRRPPIGIPTVDWYDRVAERTPRSYPSLILIDSESYNMEYKFRTLQVVLDTN
jgi:hypothetical protein